MNKDPVYVYIASRVVFKINQRWVRTCEAPGEKPILHRVMAIDEEARMVILEFMGDTLGPPQTISFDDLCGRHKDGRPRYEPVNGIPPYDPDLNPKLGDKK